MIVLNNKEPSMEPKAEPKEHTKESYVDMFRREIDAYCGYKEWCEETDDTILEMALEEIMLDEYLHAKFLRDYLIDNDMYTVEPNDPYEKKFWKIQKRVFRG